MHVAHQALLRERNRTGGSLFAPHKSSEIYPLSELSTSFMPCPTLRVATSVCLSSSRALRERWRGGVDWIRGQAESPACGVEPYSAAGAGARRPGSMGTRLTAAMRCSSASAAAVSPETASQCGDSGTNGYRTSRNTARPQHDHAQKPKLWICPEDVPKHRGPNFKGLKEACWTVACSMSEVTGTTHLRGQQRVPAASASPMDSKCTRLTAPQPLCRVSRSSA